MQTRVGNIYTKLKTGSLFSDQIVFIAGGGTSLTSEIMNHLHPLFLSNPNINVLGTNSSYLYDWIPYMCFGDVKFWEVKKKHVLHNFDGAIFSFHDDTAGDLNCFNFNRVENKIPKYPSIGWFGNTGISAILFAAMQGAREICLLGFDCYLKDGKGNWYLNTIDTNTGEVYEKFKRQFSDFQSQFSVAFPDQVVINLNPDSDLGIYPKMDFFEYIKYFEKERVKQ